MKSVETVQAEHFLRVRERRERIATAVLAQLVSMVVPPEGLHYAAGYREEADRAAQHAVLYADALIAELDKWLQAVAQGQARAPAAGGPRVSIGIKTPLTHDEAMEMALAAYGDGGWTRDGIVARVTTALMAVDVASREQATTVDPTAALIRWLDENVSKCGHGYVFVTCARCVIDQGGLR